MKKVLRLNENNLTKIISLVVEQTLKKDKWYRDQYVDGKPSLWYGFDAKTKKWVQGPCTGIVNNIDACRKKLGLKTRSQMTAKKNSTTNQQKNNILKKPLPSNLDLHLYAALRFAKLTSKPLTESELRSDTIQTLSNIICEKSLRMKTCDPNMWEGKDPKGNSNKNYLGYLDYSTLYSKSLQFDKTLKSSSFNYNQPRTIKELMLTLGQASVTKQGNNWVVSDMYNFDNIQKAKPWLKNISLGNVFHGIAVAVWEVLQGKAPTSGAEEILSQYHNFGYKGFKTKITVPIGNCGCNKM